MTFEELDCLEIEIIETINKFERIFPPSFFEIMIHLPIFLVNEVRSGVQFKIDGCILPKVKRVNSNYTFIINVIHKVS